MKLSHFASVDKLTEYFETHDLGEYLEALPEVSFDVDIQERKNIVLLDEDLAEALGRIALAEKVPSSVLINSWLREKITHAHAA